MQMNGADRAREMEIFVAVTKSGSFSAAGRVLGLTPSAVSRTIDRIEARLGVRLMLRTTRVLTLTAEGQTYLGAARRILADLDDAEQGIADINLTDVVVDVAAGQADVAIRFGPLADSPLTARRLGDTGRTIVASPDYLARRGTPTVPEDLHDHDCLNFNFRRAEPVWPFRRDGRDYALTVRGPIEANNGETLTQLAVAGVGVTRVGNFSVADAIDAGRLVPLLEDFNPGDREPIHAVFVGGANMPARVRVFVDFLAERLR